MLVPQSPHIVLWDTIVTPSVWIRKLRTRCTEQLDITPPT